MKKLYNFRKSMVVGILLAAMLTSALAANAQKKEKVILDTDMVSMLISDGMPQPTSTNAPNCSRWVTFPSITSPQRSDDIYCSMHCC